MIFGFRLRIRWGLTVAMKSDWTEKLQLALEHFKMLAFGRLILSGVLRIGLMRIVFGSLSGVVVVGSKLWLDALRLQSVILLETRLWAEVMI